MSDQWKPDPLKPLEEQLTAPIKEALAELRKQLAVDQAALREFQIRLERAQKRRP